MEIVNLIGYENIEKLAQIKMSQMNYSNIISLISLYKEMKVIDSKNNGSVQKILFINIFVIILHILQK